MLGIGAIIAGVALVLVFAQGTRAPFVSDAWIFLARAQHPFSAVLPFFNPANDPAFYRPGVEVAFWIEYRLFGLSSLPYHLVALTAHAGSSLLVGAIAWRLTHSRAGAVAAAAAFLLSVSAQEVVFDVADLHNALGGPLLLGAVLAGISGRRWLPALLMIPALLVDENSVLILPLLAAYIVIFSRPRWRQLWPLAAGLVVYLLVRLLFGVVSEASDHCISPHCLVAGMDEYLSRLVLRPDGLIVAQTNGLAVVAFVGFAALVASRKLRYWPAFAYAVIWILGSSLFMVLTLYPYVADRFLYIPSAGLALALAAIVAQAGVLRRLAESQLGQGRAALALVLTSLWIAAGGVTLAARGTGWYDAGAWAKSIVADTKLLYPDPPPGRYPRVPRRA